MMKDWIKNIRMSTWFIFIIIFILIVSNYTDFNPTQVILLLSKIFITLPLILLGIFAIPKVRGGVKQSYYHGRGMALGQIQELRKKEEKLEKMVNIEELIKIDREILSLREEMRVLKDNRFEKCIISALVLFIITIVLTSFDAGSYINTPNVILVVIFFMSGLYYIFQMIQSILYSFEMEGLYRHP